MNKKTIIVFIVLCMVIAVMDISGLPGVLLTVAVADVDAYIIPLMINFIFIGILAAVIKILKIQYDFGFTKRGLGEGLKKYALPEILAGILSFIVFLQDCIPSITLQAYGKYCWKASFIMLE